MARPRRAQRRFGIYHVSNSSQAHGPLYETEEDVERHWSALAWASREGWGQVLCAVHMTTHDHMLLQSMDGRLDRLMQRVQHAYARHFNRTRDQRRGHVYRSRYFSREIQDAIDLAVTADYIDWNPVMAGMAERPDAYPHGTARYYCGDTGLPWLARDRLEQIAARLAGENSYRAEHYAGIWRFCARAGTRDLIGRTLARRMGPVAPLTVLARSGPQYVQDWLRRQMAFEEGRTQPCLVVAGTALLAYLGTLGASADRDGSTVRVGLLHSICGWSLQESARSLGISLSTAARRLLEHRKRFMQDTSYAQQVSAIIAGVMESEYGALAVHEVMVQHP